MQLKPLSAEAFLALDFREDRWALSWRNHKAEFCVSALKPGAAEGTPIGRGLSLEAWHTLGACLARL